jgi:hypothetical protein
MAHYIPWRNTMNTITTSITASLFSLCITLTLVGCGGGGDTVPVSGGSGTPGSSSGGSDAYITVTAADVNPATAKLNQAARVHWTVAYATPTVGYHTEFHINNQPALIPGYSGLTRIFYANGDLGPVTVGKDATIICTYQDISGRPALNCGSYGSRYIDNFDLTKPLYGIVKACIYDGSMQEVCDTRATAAFTLTRTAKEVVGDGEAPRVEQNPVPAATDATGQTVL